MCFGFYSRIRSTARLKFPSAITVANCCPLKDKAPLAESKSNWLVEPAPKELPIITLSACEITKSSMISKTSSPSGGELKTNLSAPLPPVRLSAPLPPIRLSSPLPPVRISAPLPPVRISAPLLPVRLSAPSPPVRMSALLPPVSQYHHQVENQYLLPH